MSSAGYATYPLDANRDVIIGRTPGCTVVIDDASISRQHARLTVGPRYTLTITDLGSANGTSIHGHQIEPQRPTSIEIGEAVTLGKAILVIHDDADGRRRVLPRDQLLVAIDDRCRESADSNLPFRVAAIVTVHELDEAELVEAVAPELRAQDTIGRLGAREWVVVIDDVPPGRAMSGVRRASERLRARSLAATIGIATWPRDGRSASELLAAASGGATKRRDVTEIVIGKTTEALFATVDRIAASDLSVLVLGETGVGKEIVAQRLHQRSARVGKPLLKLNCAALNEQLLESELFGHVRGAFTGADQLKVGLLVAADGGTVFLDEIGELSLSMQAKLLRVLEDGEVRHVGAVEPRPVDVRFIAATNQRLDDPARFRPDLYFRISGAVIEIPPLRERPDEILPLARLFLHDIAERQGGDPLVLDDGAARVLETYGWPGNVRELRNAIERAAVVCDGGTIEPGDFPIAEMKGASRLTPPPSGNEGPTEVLLPRRGSPDRGTIVSVLAASGGNQVLAAAQLGVHRRTLMRWMDLMNIPRPRKG